MLYIASIVACVVIYYIFFHSKDTEPIFNVYNQPGRYFYLKYLTFLSIINFRKLSHEQANEVDLDKAQPLSKHPKAFDAVFFIGANKEGCYVVGGSERRHMGTINGLFYIIIPDVGVLCSPKVPDTLLFGADKDEFGAEGILFKPLEPMKTWSVSYNGPMWYQSDPNKSVDVKLNGIWKAKWKYINYDNELDSRAIARSIAREKWSKEYFDALKTAHQSHYEQFGEMDVNITVGDKSYDFKLDSFRDHSFGNKRDWELMHRYAFHHIFCEDGFSAAVGVICQPCTASWFEAGFVCLPSGKNDVYPIEWCDLMLYQHGESGVDPHDYAFQISANDKIYTIEVQVQHKSEHYVSSNWDARMVERFVKYKVNGVDGWGVSEFHYNNKSGRPEKYSKDDPDWYKRYKSQIGEDKP